MAWQSQIMPKATLRAMMVLKEKGLKDLIFVMGKEYTEKDFSPSVRTGDLVCVLLGCPVPIILQKSEDTMSSCVELVGEKMSRLALVGSRR